MESARIAQAKNMTTWPTNSAKMKARRGAIAVPLILNPRYDAKKVMVKIHSSFKMMLKGMVTTTR